MGIALKAAAELQATGQEIGAILRTLESVRRQPAAYLGDATPALNTLAQALSESANRIAEQMGANPVVLGQIGRYPFISAATSQKLH